MSTSVNPALKSKVAEAGRRSGYSCALKSMPEVRSTAALMGSTSTEVIAEGLLGAVARVAHHLAQHLLAKLRIDVHRLAAQRLAQPAIGLFAQDRVAVLVFHFVLQRDAVVVGGDFQTA